MADNIRDNTRKNFYCRSYSSGNLSCKNQCDTCIEMVIKTQNNTRKLTGESLNTK